VISNTPGHNKLALLFNMLILSLVSILAFEISRIAKLVSLE
jgi:hypothetical protein